PPLLPPNALPGLQHPSAKPPGTPLQPPRRDLAGPQSPPPVRRFNDASDQSVGRFIDGTLRNESPKGELPKEAAQAFDESAPISEAPPSTGGVALEVPSRAGGSDRADAAREGIPHHSLNANIAPLRGRSRFAMHAVDGAREPPRLPARQTR